MVSSCDARHIAAYHSSDTLFWLQEMQGRINLMQTDLPHAALWEEDPVPPRAHLLYLSGLPAGSRIGDIVPHLERAGLGRARLHFRSSGTQVRGRTGPVSQCH